MSLLFFIRFAQRALDHSVIIHFIIYGYFRGNYVPLKCVSNNSFPSLLKYVATYHITVHFTPLIEINVK